MPDRVWLSNPLTGGFFHCPAPAVPAWEEMGWTRAEAPADAPSAVIAEALEWRANLAPADPEPTPTEPSPARK